MITVSIHAPMRRATLDRSSVHAKHWVSIHAPPAEGDVLGHFVQAVNPAVSIHAPMRRATAASPATPLPCTFQATPPMRRATCNDTSRKAIRQRFNPRPPCGGRRDHPVGICLQRVSIHAPHAEGDHGRLWIRAPRRVSIHAPHAEGDVPGRRIQVDLSVSIHAPHAEGDKGKFYQVPVIRAFQSTPPMRRAT